MKISLFSDGITPFVAGGIQRHSYYLCKYLAKAGVDVDLYHTVPYFARGDGRSAASRLSSGVETSSDEASRLSTAEAQLKSGGDKTSPESDKIDLNSNPPDLTKIFTTQELNNITPHFIPFPKHKKLPGHYVRESYEYSCRVYDEFLKNSSNVDFVYSKNYTSWKYLEEKQKGKSLPPMGVKLHGYELYQKQTSLRDWMGGFFHSQPTQFNSRMADIVFSYGGKITEIMEKKVGVLPEQIREIPTGISEDWLLKDQKQTRHNGKTNFVFIGRYTRRKGIHLIEEAIPSCDPEKCTFTFIGPIPEEKQLKLPNVNYTGPLKEEVEIRKELQKADVLLCPSSAEGMPNVILEGMASGCAVIATDVGAVGEMANERSGWLIQPENAKALESSIQQSASLSLNALKEKQLQSVRIVDQHFLWDKIADRIITEIRTFTSRQ